MRIVLALTTLMFAAAPAAARDVTFEAEVLTASRWLYPEFLRTQADSPYAEASVTSCMGAVCAQVWHGRELGNSRNQETDLTLVVERDIGSGITLDGSISLFLIPGENAVDVEVGATVAVDENVSVRLSYEGDRGGFRENAVSVQVPVSFDLGRTKLTVTPSTLYLGSINEFGGALMLEAEYPLTDTITLLAFAHGFAGDGRGDAAGGIGLRFTF